MLSQEQPSQCTDGTTAIDGLNTTLELLITH